MLSKIICRIQKPVVHHGSCALTGVGR